MWFNINTCKVYLEMHKCHIRITTNVASSNPAQVRCTRFYIM